jgi:regulator-associated protein of mTOR
MSSYAVIVNIVNFHLKGWRMRERMKTVSVALVICLNVGVDPPDVTKTQPCARVECWIDPAALNPAR